tara:strand:- start:220 stop:705 length:486 start_codon:yes stop_codon:yes gene_type:complete
MFAYIMSTRGKISKCDDFNTPAEAWELIMKHIDLAGKKVWLPFFNDGDIKFEHSEIIHQDKDFFTYEPDEYDYIIDNPPFSIKQQVLERCVSLKKPFALLLPIETLERKYFKLLVKDQDFTMIIPNKRYNFVGGSNKKNVMFKSCFYCFGFGFDKQLIFED